MMAEKEGLNADIFARINEVKEIHALLEKEEIPVIKDYASYSPDKKQIEVYSLQ